MFIYIGSTMKNFKEIIITASVYMALNIGAGFTSGQEILQFFSSYGWAGFVGIFLACMIMFYGGESIIDAGWICRDNPNSSVFDYFGGSIIGKIYTVLIPIALYGSYTMMIAGAGAVLEQFFGLPNFIGRLIAIVLSVGSIFLRFQYIAKFVSHIAKIISAIILVICIIVIFNGLDNISSVNIFFKNNTIDGALDSFYSAGIVYGGTIMLTSCQFLFEVGRGLEKRNSGGYGTFFGALAYTTLLAIIHLAILLYIEDIYQLPIITIYFAELMSPIAAFVMSILLFVAMYSASTTCLWSVSNVIRKKLSRGRLRYLTIIIGLGAGCFLLSAVSFEQIVGVLYPINGMFGCFLVVLIILKNRKKAYVYDKGADVLNSPEELTQTNIPDNHEESIPKDFEDDSTEEQDINNN